MISLDETIAAIATPSGAGGARAIVRISGADAVDCLRRCFRPLNDWPSGKSSGACILPGELSGDLCQPCDAYIWPSRSSYTRQPMVELHTIGAPPLAAAALRTLCAHGARLANPGEFTLRAFLAGRLDLTQAEAILGLIDAADRRTLDVAIGQLAGGLSGPLHKLRGQLLDLLADLEAALDFAEEHIEFVTREQICDRLSVAEQQMQSLLQSLSTRGLTSDAPRVMLVGWPNTGKSSLFNALVDGKHAIVSDEGGTTRDYLQANLDLGGVTCVLVDGAGVDPDAAGHSINAIAQAMTATQTAQANLRLLCLDSTRTPNDWERQQLQDDSNTLLVLTKCDCPQTVSHPVRAVKTSALAGEGLEELKANMAACLEASSARQAVPSTAERCRASIELATNSLKAAAELAHAAAGDELVASEIRRALEELGKITGVVYTDDVLDRIFSRFCIGK